MGNWDCHCLGRVCFECESVFCCFSLQLMKWLLQWGSSEQGLFLSGNCCCWSWTGRLQAYGADVFLPYNFLSWSQTDKLHLCLPGTLTSWSLTRQSWLPTSWKESRTCHANVMPSWCSSMLTRYVLHPKRCSVQLLYAWGFLGTNTHYLSCFLIIWLKFSLLPSLKGL